jgi:hypothetical protein
VPPPAPLFFLSCSFPCCFVPLAGLALHPLTLCRPLKVQFGSRVPLDVCGSHGRLLSLLVLFAVAVVVGLKPSSVSLLPSFPALASLLRSPSPLLCSPNQETRMRFSLVATEESRSGGCWKKERVKKRRTFLPFSLLLTSHFSAQHEKRSSVAEEQKRREEKRREEKAASTATVARREYGQTMKKRRGTCPF